MVKKHLHSKINSGIFEVTKTINIMGTTNYTQEQVNQIVNFAISNNIEFDTKEKFQALMTRWIKSELSFYNEFDNLSLNQKKNLLSI